MGYSTRFEFEQALANALTTANPVEDAVTNTINIADIGNTIHSTLTNEQVLQYIRWADENIDGWLRDVYRTPLKRVNRGCFPVIIDVTAGDDFVFLADATRFNEGDLVLIRDDANSQQLTIDAVPTDTKLEFTAPITSSYLATSTNIERIRYPDPIPKMSARLAAAYFFDKYFSAQQDQNASNYGKYLRQLVYQDVNLVASGKIRLDVPEAGEYIGRRYYNLVLEDVPSSKAKPGDKWLEGGV
jgi:phage gp36-like protein